MRPSTRPKPAPDKIHFIDLEPPPADFRADVIAGLSATPRSISPKYLYDEDGSRLFDAICETPEYYVTRTEIALLDKVAREVGQLIPEGAAVIEYGSGSSIKIRELLAGLRNPSAYMALDISKDHLLNAAKSLSPDFPDVDVFAVCADFTDDIDVPTHVLGDAFRLGFLPGSTIGNFPHSEQLAILKRYGEQLGKGAALLIGADLVKDPKVLEAAYDDAAGITAQFSLNLLERMARELSADLRVSAFKHVAQYNQLSEAIEIWLESVEQTEIAVAGHRFAFEVGDKIHTELSQKYTLESFERLATAAGFGTTARWSDPNSLFSLHLLKVL